MNMVVSIGDIRRHTRGFSLIELTLAFTIGTLMLFSTLIVTTESGALYFVSQEDDALTDQSSETEGLLRALTSLQSTYGERGGNEHTRHESEESEGIRTDAYLHAISPCLDALTVSSNWESSRGVARALTFTSLLSSPEEFTKYGHGECDGTPPSTWNDVEEGTFEVTIPHGEGQTGMRLARMNGTRYAFVTLDPTVSTSTSPEFVVVNIDTEAAVASLPHDTGLRGLALAHDHAYVIRDDITTHIGIIDIENPESPTLLTTTISLSGLTCTENGTTCQRRARSITYHDGYLYVGTGYMVGNSPEFHVYCLSDTRVPGCSPTTPVLQGRLNVNHNVNDIVVGDTYAFLATSADYGEVTGVNIENKSSLSLPPNYTNPSVNRGKFNALTTGGGASDEDGRSLYLLRDRLFLGRVKASTLNERDFYILDVSNVDDIRELGSLSLGITRGGSYVSDIHVQGERAFVGTTDADQSLFVLDVGDPEAPHPVSDCGEVRTTNEVTDLAFRENMIYTLHTAGTPHIRSWSDTHSVCIP